MEQTNCGPSVAEIMLQVHEKQLQQQGVKFHIILQLYQTKSIHFFDINNERKNTC